MQVDIHWPHHQRGLALAQVRHEVIPMAPLWMRSHRSAAPLVLQETIWWLLNTRTPSIGGDLSKKDFIKNNNSSLSAQT